MDSKTNKQTKIREYIATPSLKKQIWKLCIIKEGGNEDSFIAKDKINYLPLDIKYLLMNIQEKIRIQLRKKRVQLQWWNINAEGIEYLCSKKTLGIKQLDLGYNDIGDEGLRSFKTTCWRSLNNLVLNENKITTKGCKWLSRCKFPNLKELNIVSNQIDSNGIFHIAKSNWKKLTGFYIGDNKIRKNGIRNMIKGNWKILDEAFIYDNSISLDQLLLILLAEYNNFQNFWFRKDMHYKDSSIIGVGQSDWVEKIINKKWKGNRVNYG